MVAKPVVSSVMHGFNGTIFAYGQTGSGKTYSITGCPKNYNNRGIIPRCIEQIFEYLNKNPDVYSVHLSYLEIYNEVGYDLLSPKQIIASKLEEFPRVFMLEDAKGEAHLRNLSIHSVFTEKEAMRLLFLGDTNRTIAETPTNEYSSRSHCIFTIYLSSSTNCNGKQVKSKLHIVDLAGSERVHKSNISGTILNEAKNINLSLHYLEHVILALSSRKTHVPFRNSMLTHLLRDSLCGNSLTTMLATLAVNKKNIEETVSTCKFSRRVSMISTEPMINEEEFNSQHEIYILQREISDLKSKLSKYEDSSLRNWDDERFDVDIAKTDTFNKEEYCKNLVEDFIKYNTDISKLTDVDMKICLNLMREEYFNRKQVSENILQTQVCELEIKLLQKDEEINTLKKTLELKMNGVMENKEALSPVNSFQKAPPPSAHCTLTNHNKSPPTKSPRQKFENDIREYNKKLDRKYEEAKAIADIIERCKQNIINIRTQLEQYCTDSVRNRINAELYHQQNLYRRSILSLREIEKETNHLKLGLLQVEVKMGRTNSGQLRSANSAGINTCTPRNYQITNPRKIDESQMTTDHQKSFRPNTYQITASDHHSKTVEDEFVVKNFNQAPEKEFDDRFNSFQIPYQILDISAAENKDEQATPKSFLQMLIDNDYAITNEIFQESSRNTSRDMTSCHQDLASYRSFEDGMFSHNGENLTYLFQDVESISSNRTLGADLDNLNDKKIQSPKIGEKSSDREIMRVELPEKSKVSSKPEPELLTDLHKATDSAEFKEFIKSIPLTGDREVDEEIFNFYRSKFRNKS
ncbi:hypothetical protein WA026_006192 [Henosepilachna vigintioctopunctata]|uniref:Kinesin-like protein n=1 Tax=Henosepilachna vigintioctopunctata TaxID=420089 RepID=A0AAW1TK21_9CUCU